MLELAGGMTLDIQGLTGLLAIWLLLVHTLWAGVAFRKKDETVLNNFHKICVVVWLIWLVPNLSPMFLGGMA